MKIEAFDDEFIRLSELNNKQPEINEHISSNGYKSHSMIIRDFLKTPDEFANLLATLPHFKNEREDTGRPGKSYWFSGPNTKKMSFFIRKCLFDIFKVNLDCENLYTNCFSGDMDTHRIPPHCDSHHPHDLGQGPHLVCNLGLTKGAKGGTSFWTYLKKSGVLNMTYEERNSYQNYMNDSHEFASIKHWENTDEDAEWKLEYVVPWGYNDLVVYSPTLFHQPYFEREWFLDKDRFSLASMYNVRLKDVEKIPKDMIEDAYSVWKKFELCKLLNFYF